MEERDALEATEAAIRMPSGADGRSLGDGLATLRASTGSGGFADAIALGGRVHGG